MNSEFVPLGANLKISYKKLQGALRNLNSVPEKSPIIV